MVNDGTKSIVIYGPKKIGKLKKTKITVKRVLIFVEVDPLNERIIQGIVLVVVYVAVQPGISVVFEQAEVNEGVFYFVDKTKTIEGKVLRKINVNVFFLT